MGKRFIIYGLLGFCMEVLWTGFGSLLKGDIKLTASTYVWMFFIYGLAVFLEPIHNRIRHLSFIIRGGVYMILIFTIELLSGLLLKRIIGVCPWNYVTEPFTIYGIITLSYIPVWFTAGLIFEKVHDALIQIENGLNLGKG
ncbi:putative membrane protein [Clostridium tetanomorphum]|uniref:ABC-transporter type IV n=1 Tax=Clostridium tetanomorphum TaxID=1553 RepID=A0A923E4W5_CLOTT|nr:membrane protein [Clostridium tetanomorphum]KAJ51405.1 hypothetical protein CTM_13235 [Clostridium tetanomorphum DSM 665]MBC2396388.1 hypothetical protein [Clostridium tetanomorphum]MBP1863382.1 putative membrane protein [Clostridium tetanomorphum]NRS83479.1 putative membrane protein [Clostridium tetanomorphum]NRZ96679.1 putative membrane protein [Clostridium tetanomorphum]